MKSIICLPNAFLPLLLPLPTDFISQTFTLGHVAQTGQNLLVTGVLAEQPMPCFHVLKIAVFLLTAQAQR